MKRQIFLISCLSLSSALAAAQAPPTPQITPSTPQERQVLREASDVASSLMSPFCPGRTLSACPSPRAAEWRQDIRHWLAEGVTREEILQRLQARTPEVDLASQRNPIYGWFVPIVALLIMSILIVLVGRRLLRSRQGSNDSPVAATTAVSPEDPSAAPYHELLEKELQREV